MSRVNGALELVQVLAGMARITRNLSGCLSAFGFGLRSARAERGGVEGRSTPSLRPCARGDRNRSDVCTSPGSFRTNLLPLAVLLAAPVLAGATCQTKPDSRSRDQALIHYDMGVQALQSDDARTALVEQEKAVELDPELDLAHYALGLLYHVSYGDKEKAIAHYKRALELNPKLSEAYTNLGNVYLDQGRYDEAIPLYEKALSDILYRTPYIAENNLGWCYYKKGQVQQAIDHIKSALVPNPKFCLGHRNLGIIYSETHQTEKATASFTQYARQCPEVADAHYRFGRALLASGNHEGARSELRQCAEKGRGQPLGEDCQRLLDQFSP